LLIQINTQSVMPLYEQLRNQIVFGIAAGRLEPGEALPSVRNLAADLGINLHTVNKAYSLLCDEGYIVMDRRKGAVIAAGTPASDAFAEKLSRSLALSAAEAVCRGISESEFLNLCGSNFRQALGGKL